jgi:hypothetical protein
MATERSGYAVEKKYGHFELRRYEVIVKVN